MQENYLDIDEIDKTIDKLDLEIREEKLNYDDIKNSLENMNLYYKTNNTAKLSDITFALNNKLNTILKIHDNNIYVLRKNLEMYISTKDKVAKMFDDII